MRVLIFGASGQDGTYLAEQLLNDGHEVFGGVRPTTPPPRCPAGVKTLPLDLLDPKSVDTAVRVVRPDEVYNLAAVTAPGGAWGLGEPAALAGVTGLGVLHILTAIRDRAPDARFVHASSSAVHDPHRYGLYGVSKRYAHDIVVGFRDGYGMHASNAVLYSHTSPRQDPRFLAPKICVTLAAIRAGAVIQLHLTDLVGRRDWSYAPDITAGLPLIARAPHPGDVTLASGRTRSVREFVTAALDAAGVSWDRAVTVTPGNPAPRETPADLAAATALGWAPTTSFEEMIRLMVNNAMPMSGG